MSKYEEYLKYKEYMENATRYVKGHINSACSAYTQFEFDERGTRKPEIVSKVNTEGAISYLQQCIETYSNYFAAQGLPLNKISIDLYTEFFMEQEVANKADDEYKIRGVEYTNFLQDFVNVSPSIQVASEGQDVSRMIPFELDKQSSNSFIVDYNELVSRLGELGYELNYQNFEQLLKGELRQKPATFDVDFTLEDKKTR